jgi:hypothetical protein
MGGQERNGVETAETTDVPEQLYHTLLTVIDYHTDPSGATRTVFPLGTHANLAAAKSFAAKALQGLNYEPQEFTEYIEHGNSQEWIHGDGVIVFAKAPAGQEFFVSIDTKPNTVALVAGPGGAVRLPKGRDHLHYVLQTIVDYNKDRSGAAQSTEVEGCCVSRAESMTVAKALLADVRPDLVQYDERAFWELSDDWPFGDDVFVHAVSHTGENYIVAIRTVAGAHKRHAKKD